MNKDLTLVFSSYQSLHLLKKILKQFHNKYKTVIIENSLDKKTKNYLEKNFNNTQVIIPKENLGLARSYNIGIKKSTGDIIILQNPECCHIGDIMTITNCLLKENDYLAFSSFYLEPSCIVNSDDLELFRHYQASSRFHPMFDYNENVPTLGGRTLYLFPCPLVYRTHI